MSDGSLETSFDTVFQLITKICEPILGIMNTSIAFLSSSSSGFMIAILAEFLAVTIPKGSINARNETVIMAMLAQ